MNELGALVMLFCTRGVAMDAAIEGAMDSWGGGGARLTSNWFNASEQIRLSIRAGCKKQRVPSTYFFLRTLPLTKKKIDIFLSFFEGRGFDWGQVTSCSLQLNWSVPTKVTAVKIVSVQNPVKSKKLKKLKKGEGELPSCINIRVACFQILSY